VVQSVDAIRKAAAPAPTRDGVSVVAASSFVTVKVNGAPSVPVGTSPKLRAPGENDALA
jgi:hypothetical protein